MKSDHQRRLAALFAAFCCALVLVWGTTAEPAHAVVPLIAPAAAPIVAPIAGGAIAATAAGVAVTAKVIADGFPDLSWTADVDDWAMTAWGVGDHALRYLFDSPEGPSYVGHSTTTTYGGGCWSKVAGATKTCTTTTQEVPQDGIVWTSSGLTLSSTVIASGAQMTNSEVKLRQTWSGGVFPSPSTTPWWKVRLFCNGGVESVYDFGSAAYATGATSGSIDVTFPASTCSSSAGIWDLKMFVNGNSSSTHTYTFLTEPDVPEEVPAPDHKLKTTKVCAGTDGSEATVTGLSALYKQADGSPAVPNPACPTGKTATTMTVEETDDAGSPQRVLTTWNAPDLDDPALAEYSDCLPGGSAYPCTVRLLKVTPQGQVDCTSGQVDCTDFDPATSLDTEYQCRWGEYVTPLSECTGVKTRLDASPTTPPATDEPFPSPPGSDEDVLECIGNVTWNPLSWVYQPVKCVLSWAFVPTDDPMTELQTAYDGSVIQALLVPVDTLIEAFGNLSDSLDDGVHDCTGPTAQVPLGGTGNDFTFQPLNSCSGPAQTAANAVRTILTAVIFIGGAVAIANIVLGSFGVKIFPKREGATDLDH